MRIALTGVSGFIGSVLARHLQHAGHTVTGLVRASSRRDHVEPFVDRFVIGDQSDESCWPALFDGAECVIHNSMDWQALRSGDLTRHLQTNLLAAISFLQASAPRQFIYMSSVAVHHDMRPRWQGQIDEDHPTRPGSLYGACKAAIEAHLLAAHFGEGRHTCAFRPSAVYGMDPDPKRTYGYSTVQSLKAGQPFTRPGGGKFVHVDDVAAAVTAAIANPQAAGRAFDLTDCYARWADWAKYAAELLEVKVPIDLSSPPTPKNTFSKQAANSLGVALDRGHAGIQEHLQRLIETID